MQSAFLDPILFREREWEAQAVYHYIMGMQCRKWDFCFMCVFPLKLDKQVILNYIYICSEKEASMCLCVWSSSGIFACRLKFTYTVIPLLLLLLNYNVIAKDASLKARRKQENQSSEPRIHRKISINTSMYYKEV